MGIQLGSNFDLITGLPLDSRTVVADSTARDAIASGVRYEGMVVYVEADETHYALKGGVTNSDWVAIASGESLPDQTGNDGNFLTTDGTTASWAPVDALPDQTGNDGLFLTTDGTDASWAAVPQGGGSGSKNYFDTEDSNFEGGTTGAWFTIGDASTPTTPYEELTSNANFALSPLPVPTNRQTEFTLNGERMIEAEVEVWRGSPFINYNYVFAIYEGTVGNLGDLIFSYTILNAALPSASGTKTIIPINDPVFRTGTFVVANYQTNVSNPAYDVVMRYNSAPPVFTFEGYISATQELPSTVLDLDVTATPLAGDTSLLATKTAADGEDHSYRCLLQEIDEIDRGKILFGSFAYDMTQEANYTSGDIEIQAWDVTGGGATQLYTGPDALEITKSKGIFNFTVHTEETTEFIEIRAYCRTASTSAWTNIRFDDFKLGPAAQVVAPVVTEWVSQAITLRGTTTNPSLGSGGSFTDNNYIRRVGDTLEVSIQKRFGSSGQSGGSGTWFIEPIAGYAVDVAKTGGVSGVSNPLVGRGYLVAGANSYELTTLYDVANNRFFFQYDNGTALANLTDAAPTNAGDTSGDQFRAIFSYPISGASAGAIMTENELSLQTVRMRADRNGTTQTGVNPNNSWAGLQINSKASVYAYDTHNAYNTSTYVFTAPRSGYYRIEAAVEFSSTNILTNTRYSLAVLHNSEYHLLDTTVLSSATNLRLGGSTTLYMAKGGTVSLHFYSAGNHSVNTLTLLGEARNIFLSVNQQPDYTVIGATRDSAVKHSVLSVSSTTSASSHDVYLCNATSGAFTINLPPAASNSGRVYTIKKTDTSFNAVTIDGNASETIDSATSTTLNTVGETLKIVCDGSNWIVLDRRIPAVPTLYTMTLAGVTASSQAIYYTRFGNGIQITGEITASSFSGARMDFNIPSGLTFDTTLFSGFRGSIAFIDVSANLVYLGSLYRVDTDTMACYGHEDSAWTGAGGAPVAGASGDVIEIDVFVPISGWNG